MSTKRRLSLILIDDEPEVLDSLCQDLTGVLSQLNIESCQESSEALELIKSMKEDDELIPVVITDFFMPEMDGINFLRQVRAIRLKHPPFQILLSGQANYDIVKDGINEQLVHRCLGKPWKSSELQDMVRELVSEFLLQHALDQVGHYQSLVSHRKYSQALLAVNEDRIKLQRDISEFQTCLVDPLSVSDKELLNRTRLLLNELVPRHELKDVIRTFPPRSVIFKEGDHLSALRIVLSGTVVHEKKADCLGEKILFSEGPGSMLGALAYFSKERAFTTAIAETSVEIAELPVSLLERMMGESFPFAMTFINILLRQVMQRVRSNVETNLKLAHTLAELQSAQSQLIESEKLATLGQLIAGIAHELNNPTAAIVRSVDHIFSSIGEVLKGSSDLSPQLKEGALEVFHNGYALKALSTREIREKSKAFEDFVGRGQICKTLVEMGFESPEHLKLIIHSQADIQPQLDVLTQYFNTGKFLRNIESCGGRIASLVKSLKEYARPSSSENELISLQDGLEETLLILQNRAKKVKIIKEYENLPCVFARPSELGQVWTNILVNALDALEGQESPQITLRLFLDGNSCCVGIRDNGSGMTPEVKSKIFELNYTTKKQGNYGLGLGLAICKNIIKKAGGSISVDSEPGLGTEFVIKLPATQKD